MPAAVNRVAVFGGTGFLGREIVHALAGAGLRVRVAVRHPDRAETRAGIEPVYSDVRDEASVRQALKGCDGAVNAVGLYVEKGSATFETVHEQGALAVARQCVLQGVSRLVLISGLGADLESASGYVRSRARGERLVRDAFPAATILRPSVMFGPRDRFINALADIARYSPVIPLFGRGNTKLQPVFVQDVAGACGRALEERAAGKTYELGGPGAVTYRELLSLVLAHTGRRRVLLPVPFAAWHALAAAASLLPAPPLTRDQVILMQDDNVAAEGAPGLGDLGVEPTSLKQVLPDYTW